MATGTKKRFSGVRRNQRVRIESRRDDTRTFRRRLGDATSTTSGTVGIFGSLAVASFLLSWAPFIPEVIFVVSVGVFLTHYRFGKKRWSIPFRVPHYINERMGMKVLDATTGKAAEGNIFLGRCEETGDEIWANTSDLNKHSLLIGTTGSGKTEAIMGQLFGFLALNSGGLLVDGKASMTTFGSAYKIARVFGRDADLLTMDYLTGGIDVAGLQKERRSHTYNPLAFGGPAQKSETMVSLLDGGDPMWSGRAFTFVENVIPPLSYLSDRGYLILNPKQLGDFSVLEAVENLIWFGVFRDMNDKFVFLTEDSQFAGDWSELQQRSGGIKTYLEGLPGYSTGRPPMPHRMPSMSDEEWLRIEQVFKPKGPAMDPNGRNEVSKQHGFIQMQLTRSITNLSENYGFIYGAERGEIDFRDLVLNRRLMVVLLPALERSPENLKQLGKMTTLSLKAVLGSMLNTASEGKRREIIEGNPAASTIPFAVILDEVGGYKSAGLSIIPAQARALGVAVCFGTQSIADLMKGDDKDRSIMEAEGKAILDNTAIKYFGRLTSDENSDTARTAISMGGDVHVQVADQGRFQRSGTGLDGGLSLGSGSGLTAHKQISYDDLTRQENGEFHIIVGAQDTDERGYATGGARVIRSLAFYTGAIRDIQDWRRNPFSAVKPPSKPHLKTLREAEIAARQMRGALSAVLDRPSDKLLARIRASEVDTPLGAFLAHRRAARMRGDWPEAGGAAGRAARIEAVRSWFDGHVADARRAKAVAAATERHAKWRSSLLQDAAQLGLDPLVAEAAFALAAPWQARELMALNRGRDAADRFPATDGMKQVSGTGTNPDAVPIFPSASAPEPEAMEDVIEAVLDHAAELAEEEALDMIVGAASPVVRSAIATEEAIPEDTILVSSFGLHGFQDEKHVRNFLRYLFSLTVNHPTRETTAFNMVTEWSVVHGTSHRHAAYRNTAPQKLLDTFMTRRFADLGDPAVWMDDGAYVGFIVEVEGAWFSNIVTAETHGDALVVTEVEGGMRAEAVEAAGSEAAFEAMVRRCAAASGAIRGFETASLPQREAIERKLHDAVHEVMGGRVAIAVSHNDQPTHNAHYHIHRIRMWEPGENPTVTQGEIEERNRTTTPYEGDRLPARAREPAE